MRIREGKIRKRREGEKFLASFWVKNSSSWDSMKTRKIISKFIMVIRRY